MLYMSIPFFRSMQTQARWEVCGVPVFITNLSSFQGDIPWYYNRFGLFAFVDIRPIDLISPRALCNGCIFLIRKD